MDKRERNCRRVRRTCLAAALGFLAAAAVAHAQPEKNYCRRGQACWPSDQDLRSLQTALDPAVPRVLVWAGEGTPRVSSVPAESPGDQPLFGLGVAGLKPYYYANDTTAPCFADSNFAESCIASVRNNPAEGWQPAFTVFPTTAEQVQTAVKFAVKHNLCIAVAGTGHDYLNRHSCPDAVFIRTVLLKNSSVDLIDARGFGHADGNIKYGAGIVFDEAHKIAADADRIVSSGWASTVGVVGWSLGGGHGPIVPSKGMGADNLLEVELVDAKGDLIIANSKNNSDLFWALRGGGGSTWGVVTAVTVRAHKIPAGGLTRGMATWEGILCGDSGKALDAVISKHLEWAQTLDTKWGGFWQLTLLKLDDATAAYAKCKTGYHLDMHYVFAGPNTTAEFIAGWNTIATAAPAKSVMQPTFPTWSKQLLYQSVEYIYPIWVYSPRGAYQGSLPSAVVARDLVANGALLTAIRTMISECRNNLLCEKIEIYQDVTGNLGSPRDPNVSLSPGMRNGMLHFIFAGFWNETFMRSFYALGDNSYFAESAYRMTETDWRTRYWGENYQKLVQIKSKYDPNGTFWCHHCVGDLAARDGASGTALAGSATSTVAQPTATATNKPGAGTRATNNLFIAIISAFISCLFI